MIAEYKREVVQEKYAIDVINSSGAQPLFAGIIDCINEDIAFLKMDEEQLRAALKTVGYGAKRNYINRILEG